MERMEESLILLKHELCLDWSDILVFKGSMINSKTYDTVNFKLSETQELFLNEVLLDTDIMLYKQALVKFEENILKYGTKKMLDELEKFRKFSSDSKPNYSITLKSKEFSQEMQEHIHEEMARFSNKCFQLT